MICVTVLIILIPHILWTWLFIFVLLVSNLNCCSRCKCTGLHDSRTWNRTSRWVVVYRSFSWCSLLMLIHTYQIDQTIPSNHMQYNAWGVHDCNGYGCFVSEKDPNSIGPSVFNWRQVYSLDNRSMFLGLNYPIIQPIIDNITDNDYRAMQLTFARGNYVYTSYHGFT